ncbi:hypothetical protein M569_08610 [Genlisea aurea]|uniref:Extracellular membrane protein CFEM domain-containing protein n=1 Tax=Genlisea aurea TaxID=192259 RepID=S8DSM1_9LAMI|nr:hypothetical protein M569_08610 [Genlisea aurea]
MRRNSNLVIAVIGLITMSLCAQNASASFRECYADCFAQCFKDPIHIWCFATCLKKCTVTSANTNCDYICAARQCQPTGMDDAARVEACLNRVCAVGDECNGPR